MLTPNLICWWIGDPFQVWRSFSGTWEPPYSGRWSGRSSLRQHMVRRCSWTVCRNATMYWSNTPSSSRPSHAYIWSCRIPPASYLKHSQELHSEFWFHHCPKAHTRSAEQAQVLHKEWWQHKGPQHLRNSSSPSVALRYKGSWTSGWSNDKTFCSYWWKVQIMPTTSPRLHWQCSVHGYATFYSRRPYVGAINRFL